MLDGPSWTLGDDWTVIEIRGLYDGWSIAIDPDYGWRNRWENEDGTGPAIGYESRWRAVQDYIEAHEKRA